MPNRDQDQRRSQSSSQQESSMRSNERSNLSDSATDKNKSTRQAGRVDESRDSRSWDQTDRKSSDM